MTKFTAEQIDEILNVEAVLGAYRTAMIWTGFAIEKDEQDAEQIELDALVPDAYDLETLGEDVDKEMREDVSNFCNAIREIFEEAEVPENGEDVVAGQIGYDFALTRNHHGAGFWDRGWGKLGEELTKAAQAEGGSVLEAYPDANGGWKFSLLG